MDTCIHRQIQTHMFIFMDTHSQTCIQTHICGHTCTHNQTHASMGTMSKDTHSSELVTEKYLVRNIRCENGRAPAPQSACVENNIGYAPAPPDLCPDFPRKLPFQARGPQGWCRTNSLLPAQQGLGWGPGLGSRAPRGLPPWRDQCPKQCAYQRLPLLSFVNCLSQC